MSDPRNYSFAKTAHVWGRSLLLLLLLLSALLTTRANGALQVGGVYPLQATGALQPQNLFWYDGAPHVLLGGSNSTVLQRYNADWSLNASLQYAQCTTSLRSCLLTPQSISVDVAAQLLTVLVTSLSDAPFSDAYAYCAQVVQVALGARLLSIRAVGAPLCEQENAYSSLLTGAAATDGAYLAHSTMTFITNSTLATLALPPRSYGLGAPHRIADLQMILAGAVLGNSSSSSAPPTLSSVHSASIEERDQHNSRRSSVAAAAGERLLLCGYSNADYEYALCAVDGDSFQLLQQLPVPCLFTNLLPTSRRLLVASQYSTYEQPTPLLGMSLLSADAFPSEAPQALLFNTAGLSLSLLSSTENYAFVALQSDGAGEEAQSLLMQFDISTQQPRLVDTALLPVGARAVQSILASAFTQYAADTSGHQWLVPVLIEPQDEWGVAVVSFL